VTIGRPIPDFSVVIPLYNRADSIEATIHSVLTQDFADFEIIVVDDGSKDDPEPIVNAIGDPRIHFIGQANAGGSAARNTGIDAAIGRQIAFLDSDDFFLPGKLRVMHAEMLRRPGAVLYSRMKVDRGVEKFWTRPDRGIREGEDVGEYLFCENQFIQTSTMVVPAALAKQVRFDPALQKGQDLDFCVRLQAAGAHFHMIDEALTIWVDATEAGRTSYVKGYETSLDWISRCGHLLSPKARYGYESTVLAYHMAAVRPLAAARAFFLGWLKGGVSAKVTARQILRSYLPRPIYRSLVNRFVARFGSRATPPFGTLQHEPVK
jgi:glycosyltransferase involved in cell wall biosynthesis